MQAAKEFLRAQPDIAPTAAVAQTVHSLVFERVLHHAGQFATPEKASQLSLSDVRGTRQALDSASADAQRAFEAAAKSETHEATMKNADAIATYQRAFRNEQRFPIGDDVVASLLMDDQARRTLGTEVSQNMESDRLTKDIATLKENPASTLLRDSILDAANAGTKISVERGDRETAEGIKEAQLRHDQERGLQLEKQSEQEQGLRLDELSMTPDHDHELGH